MITHTKTKLMKQQVKALAMGSGKEAYGYLMEQGTGKTLVVLEEAMRLYAAGEITALLVLAPNGVHENWIINEIPAHVPDDVPLVCAYYVSPAASNRREKAALAAVVERYEFSDVQPLRVLTCNYESLLTDACFKFVEKFVMSYKAMIMADESQKIKNMDSRRTKRALNIRKHCRVRRIGTGTAITNSPLDAFSQFEFLEEGLLGTSSYSAFRAEFCELLPPGHGVVRHLAQRKARAMGKPDMSEAQLERISPKLIKHDELGRPMYKNLDRLQALIKAHSYRVLKEDCLDLPPKVYETRYFHLSDAHRKVYDRMFEEMRFTLEDGTELMTSKLVAMGKLRQITSGFVLMRDGNVSYTEDNPRIKLLESCVEEETQQGIVWSQYKEEQRNIKKMFERLKQGVEVVNGDTPMGRRREIMKEFQAGNLQWIAAHPATMGSGFTLTAGKIVYYYSNGFNLEERLQSEDRTHRIGTVGTIVYRDLVAIDTRDDDVVWALQHKLDTAAMVNGDPQRKSRFARRGT